MLCAGPIDGIERIWVNGEEIEWHTTPGVNTSYSPSGDFSSVTIPIPIRHDQEIESTDYPNGQLQIDFHLDGSGATNTKAASAMRQYGGGEWTFDHRLEGLAWASVRLWQPDYGNNLDDRVWSSLPQIEFLVKGLKFSWPGQIAPVWTDNAAAIRYWWERNVRGVPTSAFDSPSVEAAVAACGQ